MKKALAVVLVVVLGVWAYRMFKADLEAPLSMTTATVGPFCAVIGPVDVADHVQLDQRVDHQQDEIRKSIMSTGAQAAPGAVMLFHYRGKALWQGLLVSEQDFGRVESRTAPFRAVRLPVTPGWQVRVGAGKGAVGFMLAASHLEEVGMAKADTLHLTSYGLVVDLDAGSSRLSLLPFPR